MDCSGKAKTVAKISLNFKFDSGTTEVEVSEKDWSKVVPGFFSVPGRGVVFCDEKVDFVGKELVQCLQDFGWKTYLVSFPFGFSGPCGESIKDFGQVLGWYSRLVEMGVDRSSTLFAVGGGTVGDLVGFLAATFHRGIPWVVVPTTLLSQVDSCLGGKVGVNLPEGKNLVGAFHHPKYVLCRTDLLRHLPKREMVSGFGEIFKYGLIYDPAFFFSLEALLADLESGGLGSERALSGLVAQCLRWKAQCVLEDEKDLLGKREVLNFGHTLGHALEAEGGFDTFRHGEAVIIGMRFSLFLSVIRGHLCEDQAKRADLVLKNVKVPDQYREFNPRNLWERVSKDKKVRMGKKRFILLKELGKPILDDEVSRDEFLEAYQEVL